MLVIKNTEVFGMEKALKVAGYPMKADIDVEDDTDAVFARAERLGHVDLGTGHDTFLSGILVQADIKYSQYWLKQFQRYHFMQINSSQSTMHRIMEIDIKKSMNKYVSEYHVYYLKYYICKYKKEKDKNKKYNLFMKIISNIPSGIEMWMGISTNYLQIKTIYFQRKNHKLKEDWGYFCKWAEQLPNFKEFCL